MQSNELGVIEPELPRGLSALSSSFRITSLAVWFYFSAIHPQIYKKWPKNTSSFDDIKKYMIIPAGKDSVIFVSYDILTRRSN